MSISEARRASMLSLVGIYTAVFVALAVAYMILDHFIRVENSAIGLVVAACAAMTMARSWTLREKAPPAGARAWTATILCALVTTALLCGVTALGVADDDQLLREVQHEGPATLAVVVAILLAVNLLVIRLGLWLGSRRALKSAG